MNAKTHHRGFRIGIRAHDLGRFPAGELARRVSGYGLDCVQLALGKAIEGADLRSGVISSEFARGIGAAFGRHHIRIEVLGCYINPIHPDSGKRCELLGWFKEHLRHARDFDCNVVALESGSFNADYSPHADNSGEDAFQQLLASLQELVEVAERCGVVVGIEAVSGHVISTPERMRRLLDAIPSPHLQVVFDPVNLLLPEHGMNQREVIERSLDLFGMKIAVLHAKDYRVREGRTEFCSVGAGVMEYGFLISWLACHRPGMAILLEEVGPHDVESSVAFINQQLFPENS